MRRFAERYGWTVYCLPVLLVVTMFVLADPSYGQAVGAPPAAASTPAEQPIRPLLPVATASAPPATSEDTECVNNTQAQLILVSLARQRAWGCAGAVAMYTTPVTTGDVSVGNATPTGTWTIKAKQTDRYLSGPGYSDYVSYWMQFSGDFGLHDASWQTMPFGDPAYRSQGSHGCVHLPTPAMSWLYGWAKVGATVTIDA